MTDKAGLNSEQTAIAQYGITPESVAGMASEYMALSVTLEDAPSYKICREALTKCVRTRTGTDKRRKELTEKARDWIGDVNSAAKKLIAPLAPVEAHLKAELQKEDSRKAAIRAEKERVELKRVSEIQAKIQRIVGLSSSVLNASLLEIEQAEKDLETIVVTVDEYGEFTPTADQARADAAADILTAKTLRQKLDREEKERQAEAIRLEAQKKEQEAEASRLKKVQDDITAKQKIETDKISAERKKIEDEKAAIEAERKAEEERKNREEFKRLAKIQAEKDAAEKLEKEKAEQADRELAEKKEAERQESLRPEKDKLISFAEAVKAVPYPMIKDPAILKLRNKYCDAILKLSNEIITQAGEI